MADIRPLTIMICGIPRILVIVNHVIRSSEMLICMVATLWLDRGRFSLSSCDSFCICMSHCDLLLLGRHHSIRILKFNLKVQSDLNIIFILLTSLKQISVVIYVKSSCFSYSMSSGGFKI